MTKKVGIMQPYFMPYIGYWQLLNAVDEYVIYDDVNFIKGGWINRNRILLNGEPQMINVPMIGASSNKLINEVGVNPDQNIRNKTLRMIVAAYSKAPYFKDVYPMLENIINHDSQNLADYVAYSIVKVCEYLRIDTKILLSSSLNKDCSLRAQEKVISICSLLEATDYYNAIGGQELYDFESFKKAGIDLSFVKTNFQAYKQFNNQFVGGLSIIDVLMFNSVDEVKTMLEDYELINQKQLGLR